MSSAFGGLGDAISGIAEAAPEIAAVAAAPETGGASLAPGLMSAAGSMGAAGLGLIGSSQQNSAALQRQQEANAWSAQQYATRYQTTVKDLQAAGLNPMLAYSQGAGTAPTATAAPVVNKYGAASQHVGEAAQKAIGAANTAMDTMAKDAQVTNIISQTGVNDQQRKYLAANTNNVEADTYLKILEAPNVPQKLKLLIAQTMAAKASAGAASASEAKTKMEELIMRTGDLPEAQEKGKQFQKSFDPLTQKRVESGINTAVNAIGVAKGTKAMPYQSNISKGR